jgi:cytochrome P450
VKSADPAPSAQSFKRTPGPQGITAFDAHVDPLKFLGDLVDQYGDAVHYRTRLGPCFFFSHPEHVQTVLHRENYRRASLLKMMLGDGLLATDGPFWRSGRRLMQPEFLPSSMTPFVSIMTRESTRMADAWAAASKSHRSIDVTQSMTQLTLRIVVKALFSDDLRDDPSAELCRALTQTILDLGKISWTLFGNPVRISPGRNAGFEAAKKVIDDVCYEMIARRRAMPPANRPRDLLTLLINANPTAGPNEDRQLRDEIVTMLVGGHETTALALTWAWKLLAEHPEIETTLHREVDEVLAGRVPEAADLPRLPWSRAIFQEAMRLYPPVWYIARVATEADIIDGHAIPAGAGVLVSAWFTHRHPDFWPAADRFDPTRFLDPNHKLPHRYAYFPFGGGRHQ